MVKKVPTLGIYSGKDRSNLNIIYPNVLQYLRISAMSLIPKKHFDLIKETLYLCWAPCTCINPICYPCCQASQKVNSKPCSVTQGLLSSAWCEPFSLHSYRLYPYQYYKLSFTESYHPACHPLSLGCGDFMVNLNSSSRASFGVYGDASHGEKKMLISFAQPQLQSQALRKRHSKGKGSCGSASPLQ